MGGKAEKKRRRSGVALLTERPRNHARRSSRSKTPRRSHQVTKRDAATEQRSFPIQSSHLLQPPSFDFQKYTTDVWEPDLVNQEIPGQCVEYVSDIYQRMFQAELASFPSPYLEDDSPITIEKRAVIVDWLVNIHQRYKFLSDESLYLAVNVLDRYLAVAREDLTSDNLQLVGAACMLIATKFEDIYQPSVKELVKFAANSFSAKDLMGKAAMYYMERLLLEHDSLLEPPSLLAVACVCLALNHPQIRAFDENASASPGIPSILSQYTGYGLKAIRRVAKYVAKVMATPRRTKSNNQELSAIRKKYSAIARVLDDPNADDISTARARRLSA